MVQDGSPSSDALCYEWVNSCKSPTLVTFDEPDEGALKSEDYQGPLLKAKFSKRVVKLQTATQKSRGQISVKRKRAAPFAALSLAPLADSSAPGPQRTSLPACASPPQRSSGLLDRVVNDRARGLMSGISLFERAWIGALAGAVAGAFTNAVLHPIDTVKTKLQTKGSLYTGAGDVVQKVLRKQGIAGLYSGLPAAVAGSLSSSAVYFGTYEVAKGLIAKALPEDTDRLLIPPLAAALGNITSSAILVPKEVVKQRMQAGAAGWAGEMLLGIVREEGLKGLYAGYSAALLRNIPSNVINFTTFEYLKAAWLRQSGKEVLMPWQNLLSGALAGMLSSAATTPLDVTKTRLMTQARTAVLSSGTTGRAAEMAAKARVASAFTYSGVYHTMRKVIEEEGMRGLFRGVGPRLLYGGCFGALGFLSFETMKLVLLRHYFLKPEGKLSGEDDDQRVRLSITERPEPSHREEQQGSRQVSGSLRSKKGGNDRQRSVVSSVGQAYTEPKTSA